MKDIIKETVEEWKEFSCDPEMVPHDDILILELKQALAKEIKEWKHKFELLDSGHQMSMETFLLHIERLEKKLALSEDKKNEL